MASEPDDMHARVPVDRVAVRVVMFKGESFDPNKTILTADSETPLPTRRVPETARRNPCFKNLTGVRFGRFLVMGLSEVCGAWVVRCVCGKYSVRREKAITNPKNAEDCCEHCRYLNFLKREEWFRRTGKDER